MPRTSRFGSSMFYALCTTLICCLAPGFAFAGQMTLPVLPDLPSVENTYEEDGYASAEERGGMLEIDALDPSSQPARIHREAKPDTESVRDNKYKILPYSGGVTRIDKAASSQKREDQNENVTNGKQAVGTNDDAGGVKQTEGVAKRAEGLSRLPPLQSLPPR